METLGIDVCGIGVSGTNVRDNDIRGIANWGIDI